MNTAGRLTGCLLVLTAALMPERGTAQDSPYGANPYYGGGGPDAWGQMPAGMPGGMYAPPPQAYPPGYGVGLEYGSVGPAGGGAGYYNAQGAADYWNGPSPLETTLAHYLQNGVFRLDYLSWSIQEPGRTPLGAPLGLPPNPLTGPVDPRQPFPVFDGLIPPSQIGEAVVPNLSDIDLNRLDGVRSTMVLPFYRGDFEFSAFALKEAEDVARVRDLRPQIEEFDPIFGLLTITPGNFAATSLLNNGEPSDLLLLYNQSFAAEYSSNLWGAEGVFVADAFPYSMPVRSEVLNIRPLMGFRYMDFDEQLVQVGVFDNPLDEEPSLTSVIDSVSNNDLYGVIVGTRAELVDKWFTLGVEPRWTLGWNYYENIVATDNLSAESNPTTRETDSSTIFSPMFDVKTYAKVHVHKNFSVWFGYDYMQLFRVTRPDKNIVYDSVDGVPQFRVDTEIDSIAVQGVSLGGEIIFK